MPPEKAEQLLRDVTELSILHSQYVALHNHNPPSHKSTEQQWERANVIYEKQVEIAKYLDFDVIDLNKQPTISVSRSVGFPTNQTLKQLFTYANNNLILAYKVASGERKDSNIDKHNQLVIALSMDPKAVREAMS